MIGYLRGEVLENLDGKILVSVGDRKAFGSVGYSVSVPNRGQPEYLEGQVVELFIYTHVREDALDLYGFSTKFEKSLYLTLLGVNGVGPKSALGILSGSEPNQLVEAIIQGDQTFLSRIPGIGKKTAERIVVELKDSVRKKVEMGVLVGSPRKLVGEKGLGATNRETCDEQSNLFEDASAALLGLGYREQDVRQLLHRILENSDGRPQKVEDLVRSALRQI
jgi:holliday junction DNA helicase RuvA